MKNDVWTPIPMYCSNCGHLNYGYRNEEAEFMSVPENIVRRVDPLQVDKERCDKCQTSFGYDYLIIKKNPRNTKSEGCCDG